jgi:hypothetical protein
MLPSPHSFPPLEPGRDDRGGGYEGRIRKHIELEAHGATYAATLLWRQIEMEVVPQRRPWHGLRRHPPLFLHDEAALARPPFHVPMLILRC